jgi:molecular chaperone GrpE
MGIMMHDVPNTPTLDDLAASAAIAETAPPEANSTLNGATDPAEHTPTIDELVATIARLKAEAAGAKDDHLRALAETENIRRRSVEDVQKAHKFALERFAKDLLGVKDSLDAGLASSNLTLETLKTGVEITERQLQGVFERYSITEIPSVGHKFDPNRHQGIAQVESDQEPNTIVSCLQKGYFLHERVLRPALVTIAKPKVAAAPVETPPAA